MSNQPTKILILTVKEVGDLLRIRRAKVYELISSGAIQGIKIGGDWRIRRKSIEKLIGPIPEGFFAREREASNSEIESLHPD